MSSMVKAVSWRGGPGSCSAQEAGHPSGCKLELEAQDITGKLLALCLCWKAREAGVCG